MSSAQNLGGPTPNFNVSFQQVDSGSQKANRPSGPLPPLPSMPTSTSPPPTAEQVTVSFQEINEQAPPNSAVRDVALTFKEIRDSHSPRNLEEDTDVEVTFKESTANEVIKDIKKLSVGEAILGISGKDLKSNFKAAWKKDADAGSKALTWLKRGIRTSGLALGLAVNVTSRVVAFAVGGVASALTLLNLTLRLVVSDDPLLWKNPREALALSVGMGATFGAFSGTPIGAIGNTLIRLSLNTTDKSQSFEEAFKGDIKKSLEHNVAAGAAGGVFGLVTGIVNPFCWRAAWKSGEE